MSNAYPRICASLFSLTLCTLFEPACQTYTYTPSVVGLEQPSPVAAAPSPRLFPPPRPGPPRFARGFEPLVPSVSVSRRAGKDAVQVLGLGIDTCVV